MQSFPQGLGFVQESTGKVWVAEKANSHPNILDMSATLQQGDIAFLERIKCHQGA